MSIVQCSPLKTTKRSIQSSKLTKHVCLLDLRVHPKQFTMEGTVDETILFS